MTRYVFCDEGNNPFDNEDMSGQDPPIYLTIPDLVAEIADRLPELRPDMPIEVFGELAPGQKTRAGIVATDPWAEGLWPLVAWINKTNDGTIELVGRTAVASALRGFVRTMNRSHLGMVK